VQTVGEVREGAFNPATLREFGSPTQHNTTSQPVHESPAAPATSAVGGIVNSIAAAIPSSEAVHEQLEQAKASISKLNGQADDGLRQRKGGSMDQQRLGGGQSTMSMQQSAPNGVPVPMVAALCLMCFLVAYLLF